MKKPILNTLVQMVGKGIMVLIGLVTTGLLIRKIGSEGYGGYTLIVSLFLVCDVIADFGTRIIGVREISKRLDDQLLIFKNLFWTRVLMTSVAFVLGLVMIWWFPSLDNLKQESFLVLLLIWITSLAGSMEIIFQTRMRMDLKTIGEVLFPSLFLLLLWLGGKEISLILVFQLNLVARILSILPALWINKNYLKNIKDGISFKKIKEILKLSWPMGLYLLIFAGYDRAVDSLMIERFIGVKEVAWYGLAYKIYMVLIQPAYYFMASIFPLLSNKNEDQKSLYKKSIGLMIAGVIVIIGIIYVLAPWIIVNLAGKADFEPAIKVLRILLVALFFAYLNHLNGFTLISKEGQKEMLKVGIINLTFNIILNLITIPRFGIIGAAWTTVATEALSSVLIFSRLKSSVSR